MTLEKWAESVQTGLAKFILALPDSVEREEVLDLFNALEESLNELVELESEEDE